MSAGERVQVKICGLTNLDDARHAWRCGADLLGFVLVPSSPRYVAATEVRHIGDVLRGEGCALPLVIVTTERDATAVTSHLAESGADMVQLHGGATPELVAAVSAPAIVAHGVLGRIDWGMLQGLPAWAHLLDTHDPVALGGTGRAWDWSLLRQASAESGASESSLRLFVAGGLRPDTVAEAVRQIRPWGVDVSSGVEAAPGRKSHEKVAAFVAAVRDAESVEERGLITTQSLYSWARRYHDDHQ